MLGVVVTSSRCRVVVGCRPSARPIHSSVGHVGGFSTTPGHQTRNRAPHLLHSSATGRPIRSWEGQQTRDRLRWRRQRSWCLALPALGDVYWFVPSVSRAETAAVALIHSYQRSAHLNIVRDAVRRKIASPHPIVLRNKRGMSAQLTLNHNCGAKSTRGAPRKSCGARVARA